MRAPRMKQQLGSAHRFILVNSLSGAGAGAGGVCSGASAGAVGGAGGGHAARDYCAERCAIGTAEAACSVPRVGVVGGGGQCCPRACLTSG